MGRAAGLRLSGLAIDRIGFAPVLIGGAGMASLLVGAAFALLLKRRAAIS